MQYLKQRIKNKNNIYTSIKNKDYVSIKSTNSFHNFKMSFIISPNISIQKENLSKENRTGKIEEKMLIQAEMMDNNESLYYEYNNKNAISEKYYEIYTLSGLKNIIKGFEWFISLEEFKQAFLNGINNNNYELFLKKNCLILSILIVNIFGEEHKSILFLKPINNIKTNTFKEEVNFNKIKNININDSPFDFKFSQNKINDEKTKKNIGNKSISIIINNKNYANKEFLDKKRLRTNENKINDFCNHENLKNNVGKENQKNIYNLIDDFLKDLDSFNSKMPEFKVNGISKESNILKNVDEEAIIGDRISNSNIIKYRLLYRATRDGDSSKIFHLKCDNYHNLIVLVETKEGKRFGGYTSSKFKGGNAMKIDNNAFLFSLDLKKVYNITKDKYAIDCNPKSGPSFSGGNLFIPDNFFEKFGKIGAVGGPYKFEKDYELNHGKKNFLVKELEIFQVKADIDVL